MYFFNWFLIYFSNVFCVKKTATNELQNLESAHLASHMGDLR